MLKRARQDKGDKASHSRGLLLFSVGGRQLAARMEEVVGVRPWTASIPVASRTPFVSEVVRHEQVVLPVFNLAGRLHVSIEGGHPLCLIAKHPLGNMAICIDEEMPVLQPYHSINLQAYRGNDLPTEGSYVVGTEEIPLLLMSQLLSSPG